jgi:hypothetical protein
LSNCTCQKDQTTSKDTPDEEDLKQKYKELNDKAREKKREEKVVANLELLPTPGETPAG